MTNFYFDFCTAREYKAELKEYQARHGIQTYKQFLPLLVQVLE